MSFRSTILPSKAIAMKRLYFTELQSLDTINSKLARKKTPRKKTPDNPARGSSKIEMKRVASKNLIMPAD